MSEYGNITCSYIKKCASYPHWCYNCLHNKEKKNYFLPRINGPFLYKRKGQLFNRENLIRKPRRLGFDKDIHK